MLRTFSSRPILPGAPQAPEMRGTGGFFFNLKSFHACPFLLLLSEKRIILRKVYFRTQRYSHRQIHVQIYKHLGRDVSAHVQMDGQMYVYKKPFEGTQLASLWFCYGKFLTQMVFYYIISRFLILVLSVCLSLMFLLSALKIQREH